MDYDWTTPDPRAERVKYECQDCGRRCAEEPGEPEEQTRLCGDCFDLAVWGAR